MAAKIVGGCMCGAVRYESTTDAVMQASCYCRDCQRSTGGAFAPVLLVPKDAFKLTKGQLKHYEVAGDSGGKVSRGFCANCGSPIVSLLSGMPFTAIKVGSLDDPNQFQPTASIFVASAPAWAPHFAGVPTFARNPG
jgi:hypothetical protein